MKKKRMILADSDEIYLERLSNYFMEKAPQLELNIFTDKTLLKHFLETGTGDILAVDEEMADQEMAACPNVPVKIALSSGLGGAEGFESVKKYQKTENLLNEILLKYAELTGSAEAIKGSSHTRTAAFYSPAGGTGKSVLALGMAAAGARTGCKTLYLNLEEVDSVKHVLPRTPGNLSDLFLALKTKGMNVGIKLASSVGQEPSAGFFYISGVDSVSEYGEMEGEDLSRLVQAVKNQADYDLLVLDLSSGFSERTLKILELADAVFVPVTPEEGAVSKVNRLLDETGFHEMYNSLFEKMSLVENRMTPPKWDTELRESGLTDRMRCAGIFGEIPVFRKKAEIFASADALVSAYQPLLGLMFHS